MMSGLTPAERRGASVLALVLAIGTVTDLYRAHVPGRLPGPGRFPSARVGAADTTALTAPAGAIAAPRSASAAVRPHALDLDSASVADLDALPGIGPVLAARIVEHRRAHGGFRHVDELLLVPGIGPRLLERLRPYLREPTH
jgi:competence protein ComEA